MITNTRIVKLKLFKLTILYKMINFPLKKLILINLQNILHLMIIFLLININLS